MNPCCTLPPPPCCSILPPGACPLFCEAGDPKQRPFWEGTSTCHAALLLLLLVVFSALARPGPSRSKRFDRATPSPGGTTLPPRRSSANVAGGLVPPDMLLPSLHRHPQSSLSGRIDTDPNDSPRHHPLVLL